MSRKVSCLLPTFIVSRSSHMQIIGEIQPEKTPRNPPFFFFLILFLPFYYISNVFLIFKECFLFQVTMTTSLS